MLLAFVVFVILLFKFTHFHGGLYTLKIPYRTLASLRLSAICSQAYDECRGRAMKLAAFKLFTRKCIFVADAHLLHDIVVNWSQFTNRGSYFNDPTDPSNLHLFNMQDAEWQTWRRYLNRMFHPEMLKHFTRVFHIYTQQCLKDTCGRNQQIIQEVDAFQLGITYSHCVANHIFLSKSTDSALLNQHDFRIYHKLFNPSAWNRFVDVFGYVCPSILRRFKVCDIPREVFEYLQTILQAQCADDISNLPAHTFVQQLREDRGDTVSNDQIIGVLIGLFIGSLKSTTPFIAYACYELAKAPHHQQRLREEITRTSNNNNDEDDAILSNKHLQEMTFLRQILDGGLCTNAKPCTMFACLLGFVIETLRLYTGGPLLIRECTKSCKLTLSHDDHTAGADTVDFEEGTLIFASLRRILMDPDYFSNPNEFNPSRFNNAAADDDVNNNNTNGLKIFWPFGFGRRICIGNKFVMLQTKVFLTYLLSNYEISLNHRTKTSSVETSMRLREGFLFLDFKSLHS